MAIIQAVLALISRSLGRVATALFGWAVEALFGLTSGAEKIRLSVLVGAAAAWPILLLGVVWPKAAALVLAFIPIPGFVPPWTVRLGWLALAVAVPFAVGVALATRAGGSGSPVPGTPGPPPRTPLAESRLKRLLRGVPTTLAIAASFVVVFVSVPAQRIAAIMRRHVDVYVPLVTDARAYRVVAAEVVQTLTRHGLAIEAADPPWWVNAPGRILRAFGGPSFQDHVPEQLAYFRGPGLEIALHPNGLLLRGPERQTALAHGVLVEAMTEAPAYQTFDPRAQDVERQIRSVWLTFRRNPEAHRGSPRLEKRLGEIARDIRALPVDYDEWQIVYRQALQLGRALRGESQLLTDAGAGPAERAREETLMVTNGDATRLQTLPTRELLAQTMDKAGLLVQKELALARAEIKADLDANLSMAKGLGLAAVMGLVGINLLLVAAALALAPPAAPWLPALVGGGVLVLIGAVVGYVGWSRRVTSPLALTRKSLKEDVQWAKEQLA